MKPKVYLCSAMKHPSRLTMVQLPLKSKGKGQSCFQPSMSAFCCCCSQEPSQIDARWNISSEFSPSLPVLTGWQNIPSFHIHSIIITNMIIMLLLNLYLQRDRLHRDFQPYGSFHIMEHREYGRIAFHLEGIIVFSGRVVLSCCIVLTAIMYQSKIPFLKQQHWRFL